MTFRSPEPRRPPPGRALAAGLLTTLLLALGGPGLAAAAGWEATDDTGVRLALPHPPARIVSLAPSATEMLFAIGAGSRVVATVEYSLDPPAARAVPRIGDAFAIDLERLVALRPDVIVAWPGGNNPAQVAKIERLGIPMYRQTVHALQDLPASMRRLGQLAGLAPSAEAAARDVESRLAALRAKYADRTEVSVFLQIWDRPLYTVGGRSMISDALRLCRARNVFADLSELAPAVDVESVIARDPEAIVVAAEEPSAQSWLESWKRFAGMRAVQRGALVTFHDDRLSRLGPSAVSATDRLCEAVDGVRRPAPANRAAANRLAR